MSDEVVTIELNPPSAVSTTAAHELVSSAPGDPPGLGDIPLLLPDFTVLLARLLRDPRVARRTRRVALSGSATCSRRST